MMPSDDMHKPDVSVSSSTDADDDEEMDLPGLIKDGRYYTSQPRYLKVGYAIKCGCLLLVVLILGVTFAANLERAAESIPVNPNLLIKGWLPFGLPLDGQEPNDMFGYSVTLSGDGKVIAAGAPSNDGSEVEEGGKGSVRVYEWNNDDTVLLTSGNELNGENAKDWFGSSVALSGDGLTLAAGGDGHDGNGEESGLIRVFRRESSFKRWKQVGQDIFGKGQGDAFGSAVALSDDGQILVVGAPEVYQEDADGYVNVFAYLEDFNQWVPLGVLDMAGKSIGCEFGSSIALSSAGRILAVGAPKHNNSTGLVRVYAYSEENQWEQRGQTLRGLAEGHLFGQVIDLSADGSILAVAEEGAVDDVEGRKGNGLVRVFAWNTTNNLWDQVGQTLYSEGEDDYFGSALSLSADGQTMAIGAVLEDRDHESPHSESSGHIQVFALDRKGNQWQQVGLDIGGEDDEVVGASLALSADGTVLAAGAISNSTTGHVRLYRAVF